MPYEAIKGNHHLETPCLLLYPADLWYKQLTDKNENTKVDKAAVKNLTSLYEVRSIVLKDTAGRVPQAQALQVALLSDDQH